MALMLPNSEHIFTRVHDDDLSVICRREEWHNLGVTRHLNVRKRIQSTLSEAPELSLAIFGF